MVLSVDCRSVVGRAAIRVLSAGRALPQLYPRRSDSRGSAGRERRRAGTPGTVWPVLSILWPTDFVPASWSGIRRYTDRPLCVSGCAVDDILSCRNDVPYESGVPVGRLADKVRKIIEA